MSAEAKLAELGITLPVPPVPRALYSPVVQSGGLLFVSGQLPLVDGELRVRGKVGAGVATEQANELARLCAINALANIRVALGTLDSIVRAVKVTGFVASAPGFTDQPLVINGASQLLIDVFGEAGRHARSAIGLAELPMGSPVEVEFIFEVAPAATEADPGFSAPFEVDGDIEPDVAIVLARFDGKGSGRGKGKKKRGGKKRKK